MNIHCHDILFVSDLRVTRAMSTFRVRQVSSRYPISMRNNYYGSMFSIYSLNLKRHRIYCKADSKTAVFLFHASASNTRVEQMDGCSSWRVVCALQSVPRHHECFSFTVERRDLNDFKSERKKYNRCIEFPYIEHTYIIESMHTI